MIVINKILQLVLAMTGFLKKILSIQFEFDFGKKSP